MARHKSFYSYDLTTCKTFFPREWPFSTSLLASLQKHFRSLSSYEARPCFIKPEGWTVCNLIYAKQKWSPMSVCSSRSRHIDGAMLWCSVPNQLVEDRILHLKDSRGIKLLWAKGHKAFIHRNIESDLRRVVEKNYLASSKGHTLWMMTLSFPSSMSFEMCVNCLPFGLTKVVVYLQDRLKS